MPAAAVNDLFRRDKYYEGLPDVHMDTVKGATSKWGSRSDIHKGAIPTYKDIRMETARMDPTKKMGGLNARDRLRMEDPEIRRKATLAQLCA